MGKIPSNFSRNRTNTPPPSYVESIAQAHSITSVPKDQMEALVNNIANATIASQSLSTVTRNLQDLQTRFSDMPKYIRFMLGDQELSISIQMSGGNSKLPIFGKNINDFIDLSFTLPPTLQKQGITTILDLLKKEFPKLVSSSFFNQETKIPRFVFSSPIPINDEGKGNFFPQIQLAEGSKGQISYVAWDSSGSRIARGVKEKVCDVLLENGESFCGVALSQANLEGVEKGAGVSAHFMTSKVTIIGILIAKLSTEEWLWSGLDSDGVESRLCCDGPSDLTTFGMLGVKGAYVGAQEDLLDREKRYGEKLIPFCLEIVPQFSSESSPVQEDDLIMAIEMQFQKMALEQIR